MYRLRRAPRFQSILCAQIPRQAFRPISRWSRAADENVRQVKVLPPPFMSPRRLATFALYTGCPIAVLFWLFWDAEVVVEVDEAPVDEQGKVAKRGEEVGIDEDEFTDSDSWFIPMTWATKLPREFYKGSDAEWQEFRKMATDSDRQKRIYGELVAIVSQGVAQHKGIARALGKDQKVGKVWLDVTFPDGPPQEYSRKGLEIGAGFLAWSEQRITQQEYQRTMRALWPTALVSSLHAYWKTMWGFQTQRIRASLGLETKPEPGTPEHRANSLLQVLQTQQASKQSRSLGKAQTDPQSSVTERSQAGLETTTTDSDSKPSASASTDEKPWWFPPLPSVHPGLPGEEMEQVIATTMFAHTLSKGWRESSGTKEPPRGTFVVSGLLQVKGSRGQITLDVQGFYDPRISRYVVINISPRLYKKWNQAPRGGP
ncbi:hypothetical protein MBLNU457_7762t1 [Dothideomycetes sp. NU457]